MISTGTEPEAWAMKYFNSVSLLTGLGPPRVREPWSFEIGLELDTIPRLDEDQRRVGFGGAKVEDLNRLPAFFRPRLTIGLPAKWSLDVAYAATDRSSWGEIAPFRPRA